MPVISKIMPVKANGDSGITVDTDAYSDGDVVGGLLTFQIEGGAGFGLINRVRLIDEDSQDEPYNLYIFDAAPTTIADDAAFAPSVEDLQKLIAVVSISGATTVNSLDFWHSATLNYAFRATSGYLYGYLVANGGTPDYGTADTLTLFLDIVSEG